MHLSTCLVLICLANPISLWIKTATVNTGNDLQAALSSSAYLENQLVGDLTTFESIYCHSDVLGLAQQIRGSLESS